MAVARSIDDWPPPPVTVQSGPLGCSRVTVDGAGRVALSEKPRFRASVRANGLNDEPGWRPEPPPSAPTARLTSEALKSVPPIIARTRPRAPMATIDAAGSSGRRVEVTVS